MDSMQFSLSPYSFNALALLIIGLAGTLYLLRLKEKTPAIYLITIVLAGFTVGMASWLASGIVFWGSALSPFTEACAVVSMAGVIVFVYHYPQEVNSLEARLVCFFAVLVGLAALSASLFYAGRFLANHGAALWAPPAAFWMLNPVMSLAALGICLRRTLAVQSIRQPGGWRGFLSAFWQPQSRAARLLRNFSFAVLVGMVQGIVSLLDSFVLFPAMLAALLINLSFSLMFVVVVYSVFDLTNQQPRLVVRLVGLSLVAVLGISGIVGMCSVNMASEWIKEQIHVDLALTQPALGAGSSISLPKVVVYVLAVPAGEAASNLFAERLVYAQPGVDTQPLLHESLSNAAIPVWGYFINPVGLCLEGKRALLRYGSHPAGSYYQYVGCPVNEAGVDYEILLGLARAANQGFDLDEVALLVSIVSQVD